MVGLRRRDPDSPLTEREVAAHPLPDSKEWTPARRVAFELLVGESAGDRLAAMDHDIRVRGRLRWNIGPVVADAMRGYPWIGLPSGGIHVIGQIERDVRGVLVVENADAFQYVCLWPDVTDTWLCVWGRVAPAAVAGRMATADLALTAARRARPGRRTPMPSPPRFYKDC